MNRDTADPNYLMIGTHPMSNVPSSLAAAVDTSSGMAPIIEIATYADTDVYECYIRGQESNIVMRRTMDDWVNVTQVFKIAQFSKTQRTKILEKESTNMKHEKVQGGYGRFQGTWVPLEAAKFMTTKYNIDNPVVNTILSFILNPNNPPPKRHKNSVLRKTSPGTKITSPSSYKKTPKKPNANSASKLSTSYTKRKKNSTQPNPSPLQNMVFRTPQQSHLASIPTSELNMNQHGDTDATINAAYSAMSHSKTNETPLSQGYLATQKPLQFYPVPTNVGQQQEKSRRGFTSFVPFVPEGQDNSHVNNKSDIPAITVDDMSKSQKNVKKRIKKSKFKESNEVEYMENIPEEGRDQQYGNGNYQSEPVKRQYRKRKVKEQDAYGMYKNKDQYEQDQAKNYNLHTDAFSYPNGAVADPYNFNDGNALQYNMTIQNDGDEAIKIESYKETLLKVLSSEEDTTRPDYALPAELYHPPANLNINFQIDDQGHTPLHWTAAMANIPLVKLLIGLNANALHCNSQGFNCITKAVFYNNCHKNGAFPELISLLKICLITPDKNGRLPLHYLVELSVNKTKDPNVIMTYLDDIVKNLGQGDESLLRMCLNYQDNVGNTPLHLAALNLNLQLCNKLCQLGASMTVSNFNNETPALILTRFNLVPPTNPSMSLPTAPTSSSSNDKNRYYRGESMQEQVYAVNNSLGNPVSVPKSNMMKNSSKTKKVNTRKQQNSQSEDTKFTTMDAGTPNSIIRNVNDKNEEFSTPKINHIHDSNLLDTQDTTGLHTIMDDLSHMESLVTSSVIKDTKMTPSKVLGGSPISPKKLQMHPVGGSYISSNLKNPVPLMDIMASPSGTLMNEDGASEKDGHILENIEKFGSASSTLFEGLKSQFQSLQTDVEVSESALSEIASHLESISHQRQALLHSMKETEGLQSESELHHSTEQLREVVNQTNEMFTQGMENSQALRLAMLIQREESKVETERNNGVSIQESLDYAVELSVLQFKRRLIMHKIREQRCKSTSSTKINKYKRLIGLNVTDINAKLDEIERELTTKA
ncbi:Regulatory protein SWI4 [Nakaseomyces glabratus]|uniref:Regulatory protein SWI4 n=1 Tax=Candida glabrata TaxID=5478 RepID=A0A0W0CNH0_CANGB|nr:Regulatory protein SWI4 [Nakaseomyces glabratus]KTB00957.1 Regulatory protein SWI4 [Nakaseomyces glabratus]KTB00974.1 Regulatory protein SWI4 [Nakaseomyces glabratus]KTB18434.1 Regulatory protein SWI4 [Nakaseomyces glabratus]